MLYKNDSNSMEEIIRGIYSGDAILFVGAGFSCGATGFKGELPIGEELKNIICKLMNKPSNNKQDLSQIADFFLGNYCKDKPTKIKDFISQMKDIFTVTTVNSYHITIASLPWRRIYTTNYDNVIEEAAKKKNKRIESKDLQDLENSSVMEDYYCLHINGRIENLNEETLNKNFKLTSSSYISHETGVDTSWKRRFIDDIEISPLIIFIGYSLYDIAIEKILFENNSSIKNKTIFIQRKDFDEIDKYKLEKYGIVYSMGVEEFAKLIEKFSPSVNIEEEMYLKCFSELKLIKKPLEPIREIEIEKFFMYGNITDDRMQDETIRQLGKPPFLIPRNKIERALEIIENNKVKILVVTGDIGNGKTIFLKQLAIKLVKKGQVFTLKIKGNEASMKQDIDKIVKLNKNSIIVIDSYTRYTKVLEYIISQHYDDLIIILAARKYEHYRYLEENEYLKSASEIEIDTLDDAELDYFYNIIEQGGMWYPSSKNIKPKYTKERKMRIMQCDCKKEISLILVEILESEIMRNKIKKILENLFNSQINKKQVFAICLLNYMDIPISISLLEEIIGEHDLTIYKDENFKNIINLNLTNRDNEIFVKSPIFSLLILKTCFANESTQYFLEILHLIMKKLNRDGLLDEIRKNLFRFRFIERLLPSEGKIEKLKKYYEDLRREFKYLTDDPQYWLQYAMCFIMHNDLDKAQQKLYTAYEKAEKSNYDVTKIDNQQARLFLKKASRTDINIEEAVDLFFRANKLLTKQRNDTYKYKIMMDYKDFIDARFSSFNQEQWNQIIMHCKKQLETLNFIISKDRFKEQKIYEDCKMIFEEIMQRNRAETIINSK